MNVKIFSEIWHRLNKDIFARTQTRLTLQYSGILMVFLILFTVIVYSLLYKVILSDQENEIRALADQSLRLLQEGLDKQSRRYPLELANLDLEVIGENQLFYYVVDNKGRLLDSKEVALPLRQELFPLVRGWIPELNEVRTVRLKLAYPGRGPGRRFQRPQDTELQIMMVGRPIVRDGEFIGMLYVGNNITFVHQIFDWILRVLGGLATLFLGVAAVISYFMSKKAMTPIVQAFNKQREFVADASHELRTPLSVLLSSINALEMGECIHQDEFSSKLLHNMKDEVKRMARLVGDLLTLARSDSGTIILKYESFDLRSSAQRVLQSVEQLAVVKQITLTLHADEPVMVRGDQERLTQLLYILLDNAIKYSHDGGEVALTLSKSASQFSMIVQDTGIGIKTEDLEHIFDRFYRADKVRSRQLGGHGLGLSIAKWITEAHQGRISVSSKLGEGSTFTVQIPINTKLTQET